MGRKRTKCIWRIETKDNDTTSTSPTQKKRKFRVEVDTSEYAIGGVLSQEQEGKWKPVAFLSRTMSPMEKNYKIYNKELLAIVKALDK